MPFSGVAIPPGAVMRVKLKIGEEWYDSDATLVVSAVLLYFQYIPTRPVFGFVIYSKCHVWYRLSLIVMISPYII